MAASFEPDLDLEAHKDLVGSGHRFGSVTYRGEAWDLSHLNPFGFRADIGKAPETLLVDVVVFFSCHCFTHGNRAGATLASDYYRDDREVRTLCRERYALSLRYLPRIVKELSERHIRTVSSEPNFMTLEVIEPDGSAGLYVVFFTVKRDQVRKRRLILRVQSAYRVDSLTTQQRKAGKVNFSVLLRAAYEGRKIKG